MKYIDDIRAALGITGVALAGYGCWLHYAPLGFIVGGGLLLALSVIGALRAKAD